MSQYHRRVDFIDVNGKDREVFTDLTVVISNLLKEEWTEGHINGETPLNTTQKIAFDQYGSFVKYQREAALAYLDVTLKDQPDDLSGQNLAAFLAHQEETTFGDERHMSQILLTSKPVLITAGVGVIGLAALIIPTLI